MLRAAIGYAERYRLAVFPLSPRDKLPLISRKRGGRGVLDATTDLDVVSKWWRQWPSANIGIAMGDVSGGIFAVDIDPRNEGDASWFALCSGKHVPETAEAVTGGGGQHLLFRGLVAGTVLADGVDIKSAGGYIVAPPSVHPNGRRYLWEASSRLDEVPIAEAPDWLLTMLGSKRSKRSTPQHSTSVDPESFVLGAAFKAAGWLGHEVRPGVFAVLCPNRHAHSQGRDFDSSTVVFAPEPGRRRGRFFCAHEHCREVWR
ncbi:MAG: bifunctional DNA primase/polymerase [Polyangiaceae bacterium]